MVRQMKTDEDGKRDRERETLPRPRVNTFDSKVEFERQNTGWKVGNERKKSVQMMDRG